MSQTVLLEKAGRATSSGSVPLLLNLTGFTATKNKKKSACRFMFNVIIGLVIQLVHVVERAPTQLHDYAALPAAFLNVCDINCLMHFFTGSQSDRECGVGGSSMSFIALSTDS